MASLMAKCPAAMPSHQRRVNTQRTLQSPFLSQRACLVLPQHSRARQASVCQAGKVTKITGEQLELEIQSRDRHLIVDFFATWCGPCLLLAQELEKVADQLGDKVKVLKVDVDENQGLSSQLQIQGLPTVVFIPKDADKPALRTEGLLPAQQIIEIVNDL